MMAVLTGAWAWFTGSKVGRVLGVVLLAGLALLGLRRRWKAEGRRDVRDKAVKAAADRREDRAEIDRDIHHAGGAADRLRDEWTRD